MSRPAAIEIVPSVGSSSRISILIRVDLPQPVRGRPEDELATVDRQQTRSTTRWPPGTPADVRISMIGAPPLRTLGLFGRVPLRARRLLGSSSFRKPSGSPLFPGRGNPSLTGISHKAAGQGSFLQS